MAKPPDIQRGEAITADFLNRSKNHPPNAIRGSGGISVRRQGDDLVVGQARGNNARGNTGAAFLVKVTGALPTPGQYTGTEMMRATDGSIIERPSGLVFDASRPLVELNRLPLAGYGFVVRATTSVTDSLVTAEFNSPTAGQFWAKITAATVLGDSRWAYSWTQQVRNANGFEDATNAWTGAASNGLTRALNSMEANNAATGVQGNSVDLDGQIFTDNAGLEIKEIRGNPVVRMHAEPNGSGNYYYTFEAANAIDGECA